MTRIQSTFVALIAVQATHSVEEYVGRLYQVFPPARLVSGLISSDLERGFVIANIALVAFGLWCAAFPVRHQWRSSAGFIWCWIVIEVINGLGHPLWSLRQMSYTAGVATAPILLVLAIRLVWLLRSRPGAAVHARGAGSSPRAAGHFGL